MTKGYYEQEYATKREVIDIATEIATEIVNDADEIEGKVLTFANLPLANQHTDKIWLVEQSSGVWLINYKQAGLYKSDGTNWILLDSTSDIVNTLNNKADKTITLTAGSGLAGGGDLSANRTISHSDTSTQANVVNSGGNVLQSANLDDFGHITSFTSTDLDARYVLLSGAYANPTWITSLGANKLTGTIPSGVLGASTVYIGTTAIALNRASGNQELTGINSIQYVGATSGGATLQAPAVAGTTTFTLPTTSGNLIGSGDTGTVSGNMLANSGVVAGTYQSATTITPLTIDAKGRITNTGTAVTIAPLFSSIASKPTTISGYGIIDGVTLTGTQTLTNKTFTDNTTFFQDNLDNTKKAQFQLSSIATATTRTYSLPNVNGTIITTGDTATITNAMLDGSIVDGKLNTITTAGKVANSATSATNLNTASSIVARDASGNFSAGTITGALSGNASTATVLQTARNINGVSFNGSANITIADNTKLPLTGGNITDNLGIGNSSPAVKLHIESAGNTYTSPSVNNLASIYCYNTNGASATAHSILALRTNGVGGGNTFVSMDIAGITGWSFGIDNADSRKFKISNAWDSLTTQTKLTIQTDGKVGIGTTTPMAPLHIAGSNANGTMAISGTNYTTHFNYGTNEDVYLRAGKTTGNIYIADVNNRVGIGTTSPSEKLTITGQTLADAFRTVAADTPIITKQFDPFTSGAKNGFGRWGLFQEPGRIAIGYPSNTGQEPKIIRYNVDSTIASENTIVHTGNLSSTIGNSTKFIYTLPDTGGTAQWIKLGGWSSTSQNGQKLNIKINASNGYNASLYQNQQTEIFFKTSNNGDFQAGSAGNFFADGYYIVEGLNRSSPSIVRVIQVSTTSYDVFAFMNSFTGGSFYEVSESGGTWTNASSFTTPSGNYVDLYEYGRILKRSIIGGGSANLKMDNISLTVSDNAGGKWIYLSSATSTNLNGNVIRTYALNNALGAWTATITNLANNSLLLLGNGSDNFTQNGMVDGVITDTNTNRSYRFTWQYMTSTKHLLTIEAIHY